MRQQRNNEHYSRADQRVGSRSYVSEIILKDEVETNGFFRMIFSTCLLMLIILFCSSFTIAATTNASSLTADSDSLLTYLNKEKMNLIQLNQQNVSLTAPTEQQTLEKKTAQNNALLALTSAKLTSFDDFLVDQRKQQKIIASKLKKLTVLAGSKPSDPELVAQIEQLTTLAKVNNQTIALISENLTLAHRLEATLINQKQQLDAWSVQKKEARHFSVLQQQIEALQKVRSELYQKNVLLQKNRKDSGDFSQVYTDELAIQLNNQSVALIHAQIAELELQIKLLKANDMLLKQHDIKTILSVIDIEKNAIEQLGNIRWSLSKLLEQLKQERTYPVSNELKYRIQVLQDKATKFLQQETEREKKLEIELESTQQNLKKQLSVRQTLEGYQITGWADLRNEFTRAPVQVSAYFSNLLFKIKEGYVRQDGWMKTFILSVFAIVGVSGLLLNRRFRRVTQEKARSMLTAHLYDGVLLLLARNILQLGMLVMLLLMSFLMQIPLSSFNLIIHLLMVWLIFRNLIIIARLILLERERNVSGKDVRFYYRLQWLLTVGGWATALMVLSQKIPLTMLLQDVCTRLFMLFIFALACVMWVSKDVFPLLLRSVLKTKKRYFRHAVTLLFLLLPFTLFTTAIMGLIGYMNLAWSMSRYQAYFVIVIITYVFARGLLSDALELISEWMITSLKHGWLWIEVFLKPLDKITHIVLFLSSLILLFELFGIYTEMPVLTILQKFGNTVLLDVSGIHITLISVLEFFIVGSVFVWAAKWTREFGYRWLYRDARDEGVRNSLSVFTQYAVILLGSYITLRVLGLDFSGMSIVLGGLAVGMGFGLRDFASNIVGGIMLLIERPVREGDLITLGEHEGRVAHIGIRSMRVSSWDNTEVLIPNAETFNKPFINWTHQDSVVRTVVPVKVSREDDPLLIQRLIFEVLAIIPEILDEPPSQVFLKQIDEALIDFEVRYFINVRLHTRFEVRSKLLFALTAQFKAAGIRPPIPPLSVELKDKQGNDVVQPQSSDK